MVKSKQTEILKRKVIYLFFVKTTTGDWLLMVRKFDGKKIYEIHNNNESPKEILTNLALCNHSV